MNNIIQECITRRRIVELFLKYPKREFTVNQMSKISGISYATAWRFIQKLDKSGIIFAHPVGHSLACTLNESAPFLNEVKAALDIESSPHRLAAKDFVRRAKKLKGIKKIILFGSVSKGTEKLRSDVDIAVVVDRAYKYLDNMTTIISGEILEKSKMQVTPIVLTEKEYWENAQFAGELEKGIILYERDKRS
ncbi:Nucleotidyltransferase domain protein [uncultured archaeon]|nr:Nucleotidyltransferase domain protein [uncultured archaeon]